MKDKNTEKKNYKCGWCGNEFVVEIRRITERSEVQYLGKINKRSSVSSQVMCPYCKNNLKT